MEDKKRYSLSVRSEFLQEMRDLSMRMIEAVYFIFFLPLSAIENQELSSQIMSTSYASLSCIVNLAFFSFLYSVKTKSQRWKLDSEMKGYWVEVAQPKSDKVGVSEWNPKKYRDFNKGDIVTFESKHFRLEGYGKGIWSDLRGSDQFIHVVLF